MGWKAGDEHGIERPSGMLLTPSTNSYSRRLPAERNCLPRGLKPAVSPISPHPSAHIFLHISYISSSTHYHICEFPLPPRHPKAYSSAAFFFSREDVNEETYLPVVDPVDCTWTRFLARAALQGRSGRQKQRILTQSACSCAL